MDNEGLSNILTESLSLQQRNRVLQVPYVTNAGSNSSPSILSPRNENDFFLSTSAATATAPGKYQRQDSEGPGRDSAILPSIASPIPQGQATGALPLFSPNELFEQQHQTALFTAGLASRPPQYNLATVDSCLDSSLPTPPDNNLFNLRLPSFDQLGIAASHPDDLKHDQEKLLIQSVFPDRLTITSPLRAPRPHLRNSDSIEFDVGANTPEPCFEPSIQLDEHNYFPQPLLPRDIDHELADVLTPPDDEPDVELEIRWMPPIEKLGDERKVGSAGFTALAGQQAVAGAPLAGSAGGARSSITGEVLSGAVEEATAPTWLEDAIQAISKFVSISLANSASFRRSR